MKVKSVKLKFDHILKMTSRIGFYQFAKITSPDFRFGYSLDDQARALILAIKLYQNTDQSKFKKIAKIYLRFILRAQMASGLFHNFANQKGEFVDNIGSEDCFGRVIWALGYTIYSNISQFKNRALKIWQKAAKNLDSIEPLRSRSFIILGLYYYLKKNPEEKYLNIFKKIADSVISDYQKNSTKDWQWFENALFYSNAIIPYSLFKAYQIIKNQIYFGTAVKSLNFLNQICREDGKPAPIGSDGWYLRGKKKALFRQQPIDVADMVLANSEAFYLTQEEKYSSQAQFWFSWFLGNNLLGKKLYNPEDGGCRDGLFSDQLNPNQGAESTILFQLANLALKDLERSKI